MEKAEHVLVVGGGQELPELLRSARPGCRTSVLCQLSLVPRLRKVEQHARVVALRPDADDREWVEAARRIHDGDPLTRVATFGERDQRRAAAIGAALGLPTHAPRTVAAVHDKDLMRRVLADAGVEDVSAQRLTGRDEVARWLRTHPRTWIVKPVDGAGSAGVAVVRSPAEAAAAYDRCVAAAHTGRRHAPDVLVEEYLVGRQVSVESYSEDGEHAVVAITAKYSDPASFVELGHVVPAPLDEAQRTAVTSHTVAVLDALGVRDGVCHTEFVLTPAGPRTIETHLRLAGDEIPYLVRDATGVDLVDCVVRRTFGERVLPSVRRKLATTPVRPQAIWFGTAPCAGVLDRVDGLDRAAAVDPSVTVVCEASPGDTVDVLSDSDSRILWARASADDPQEAVRRAFAAVAACRPVLAVSPVPTAGIDAAL